MGGDFSYQNAHANFMNMDPLVKRLNEKYGDRANFFYSTPNDYLKAVHATNTTWPLKTDDFFPYAD